MDKYDVKRLALVLAIEAEIEGAKVENKTREHFKAPPLYMEGYFTRKADELRNLAYALDEEV